MISYAQAREDVLLHRALHHVPFSEGFYIDVGGFHPSQDSVTKHFYDHGWSGINIEPARELFKLFPSARPRDLNLQVAVSDRDGEVIFHEVEGQLGTLVDRFADRHEQAGFARQSYTVECLTLTQVCERYVGNREVHFLKLDIEGHEAAAIHGMDFTRYRPWVLVVEAVEPNNVSVPTYHEWDPRLIASGYRYVYGDSINRYYVASERSELDRYFSVPADDYVYARYVDRLSSLEQKLEAVRQIIVQAV